MKWYDWLLGKDSRSECRDFLARQSQHETQCGVVDLFHEFVTNILLKQLSLFFMAIADMVASIGKTYGILITAVVLFFMKDILVTVIQSVFRYILNPTIWSRVAVDISAASSTEVRIETVQRNSSGSEPDMRDINMGKVLDLFGQQMQYVLETKNNGTTPIQPSGVEMLSVTAGIAGTIATPIAPVTPTISIEEAAIDQIIKDHIKKSKKKIYQSKNEPNLSDESTESYEEINTDEMIISQNASIVSISSGSQPGELTSEHSATISTTESAGSTESSDSSGTSIGSKHTGDSVEILSISSDATTEAASSSASSSAFRDL